MVVAYFNFGALKPNGDDHFFSNSAPWFDSLRFAFTNFSLARVDLVAKKILVIVAVFSFTLLNPQPLSFESTNLSVVWNVGQGQWFTRIENLRCLHFDAGGEVSAIQQVTKLCNFKKNFLFLSHWDWDHLSFVGALFRRLPNLCLFDLPAGEASAVKKRIIQSLPRCESTPREIVVLDRPNNYVAQLPARQAKRLRIIANDFSQVFAYNDWLIPGDSPVKNERRWAQRVPKKIRILLLGHHGSRTSTSQDLLRHLPNVFVAISSSRFKRYGHPHKEIRRRLNDADITLLRTEDWGSLAFADF